LKKRIKEAGHEYLVLDRVTKEGFPRRQKFIKMLTLGSMDTISVLT
jgi:hypothetical protein